MIQQVVQAQPEFQRFVAQELPGDVEVHHGVGVDRALASLAVVHVDPPRVQEAQLEARPRAIPRQGEPSEHLGKAGDAFAGTVDVHEVEGRVVDLLHEVEMLVPRDPRVASERPVTATPPTASISTPR